MNTIRSVVFGPPDGRVAGALASASGREATTPVEIRSGVVVCDPFGIEALAADRTMNHLTAELVAAGHTVLRFSPPGLGNSADVAAGHSIVRPWLTAIGAAIDVLRHETACAHITVLGLRIGATLAAEVASGRNDVDRVVLWAPLGGRPFVRELKMLGAGVASVPEGFPCPTASAFAVEAGGYGLNEASAAALSAIDPLTWTHSPAPEVLAIDRDDVRSAGKLIAHLRGLGAHVDSPELAGYAAMRLDDPETGDVPTAAIAAIAEWVSRPFPGTVLDAAPPETAAVGAELELQLDSCGSRLVETTVWIPVKGGRELHGIVTRQADSDTNGHAILLLTTGSNPCCGPGSLHTRLARHWANAGHTVVRLDRRGVGLSELAELLHIGSPESWNTADERTSPLGQAYEQAHIDDVSTVEHYVRVEFGLEQVILVGTCSGAYVAYRAARAERTGTGVHAVIALNQIIFDDHAWTTDGESPAYAIKARYELGQALRHPSRWMDLARGDIPVLPAVTRLIRFARLRLRTTIRSAAARLRGRDAPAVGVNGDLQAIAAAGIRQTYVFDEAETGLGYLRLHLDGRTAALTRTGMLNQHTVSGAGHTFGPEWSKEWLIATLDRSLAELA